MSEALPWESYHSHAQCASEHVNAVSFGRARALKLFLFGAAPLLYGVAMLHSAEHHGLTGWIGVVFGPVSLAAAGIQMMSGKSWLAFYVLFPIASIAITLWIIYLGFRMWRMALRAT